MINLSEARSKLCLYRLGSSLLEHLLWEIACQREIIKIEFSVYNIWRSSLDSYQLTENTLQLEISALPSLVNS